MSFKGVIGEVVEIGRGDGEISSFEWRIPDFLSMAGERDDFYDSPSFDACDGRWYFKLYPYGMSWEYPWYSVILLLFRLDVGPPKTLDVKLGIRGPEGVENKRGRRHEFSKDDPVCCWCGFCSTSHLTKQKSRLMPGNVLIVFLDLRSVLPSVAKEVDALLRSEQNGLKSEEDSEVTLKEQGTEELKESLNKLVLSGKDSDVIVKVQGKEFPVHRLILRARSDVFDAMFNHDMLEKQRGVVTIEDCDQETFPDFLEHVYTGSVEMISTGNVFSLFAASDKYDLKTLKKACAEFVKKNLTVASFCNAITLAIKHDEKELTELATEFFCSHSLEICKTVEWQVFLTENPIVGNELIIKGFSKYQHT